MPSNYWIVSLGQLHISTSKNRAASQKAKNDEKAESKNSLQAIAEEEDDANDVGQVEDGTECRKEGKTKM